MSENQTQESRTKKANNSTQDVQRLRVWQRLPAQTEQEPQSVAGMFSRTPSNLLTQRAVSWPRSAVVQTKLTVNEPDDMYEQEADQMADAVMRMPNETSASEADSSPSQPSSPSVNATAEAEPEKESDLEEMDWMADTVMRLPYHTSGIPVAESGLSSIQAKLIHRACTACEEDTLAARKAAADKPPTVTAPVENRIQNMNGSGNPLPDTERSFFESRMGADFSGVRIHNDTNAAQSSRDLSARAFTVGNNIAFNSGEYQPGTTAGRELLAHELTHTMQQGAAPQLKRKPEAEEGICPVCGKKGKGTCSGCGQAFMPPSAVLGVGESDNAVQRLAVDEEEKKPSTEFASEGASPVSQEAAEAKVPDMAEEQKETPEQSLEAAEEGNIEAVEQAAPEAAVPTEEVAQTPESDMASPLEQEEPLDKAEMDPEEVKSRVEEDKIETGQPLTTADALSEGLKEDQEITDLATGDLALIDEELAEHQQWAGASGKVGDAGSVERAEFIADTAGEGFLSGAGTGFGMGLAMGGVGRAATKFIPVPGVGAILGGGMSVYGLASKDWSATGKNISEFGEGSSTYEKLANSLEAIGEIVDIISNIVGMIGGVAGVIATVAGALSATGILAPVAGPVAAGALLVGTGTSVASGILDLINSAILQPTAMLFRALHMFKSEADPREIEQQSQELAQAAGTLGGALGSAAGSKTADTIADKMFDKPAQVDTDEPPIKTDDSRTDKQLLGDAAESKVQEQLPESANLNEITGKKNFTDYDIQSPTEAAQVKAFSEQNITKYKKALKTARGVNVDGEYKNIKSANDIFALKQNNPERWNEIKQHFPEGVQKAETPNDIAQAMGEIGTLRISKEQVSSVQEKISADIEKNPQAWGLDKKNKNFKDQKQKIVESIKPFDDKSTTADLKQKIEADKNGTSQTTDEKSSSLKEEFIKWWVANKATSLARQEQGEQVTDDGQMERTERVNPAYTDPPGTPEQIKVIQDEIVGLLQTRAQAEQAETEMTGQEAEHQENEAPLEEAVQETSDGISASEAHQEAVTRRQQANLEQQERQQDAQKNLADYANRAAGFTVLTVPLSAFEGFTHYASKALGLVKKFSWLVPDSIENQILSWKQNMDDMNKDAREFQAALKQMDFAMSKQSSEQPARQQELQDDQSRIENVNEKTDSSKQKFEVAHQSAQELKQLNQDKIAEASTAKEEATGEKGELDNAIGEKETQAQSLTEALQTWAEEHKAAREIAISATKEKLQSQGYEIVPSGE